MPNNHSTETSKAVYICLSVFVFFVLSCFLLYFSLGAVRYAQASKTVFLTDLNQETEISVHAPVFPWCTGDLYVLYEGVIDANAALEVVSNRRRDHETIPLQAGKVSGVYGGAEYWVDNLCVRVVPHGTTHGTLKITVICGRAFTDDERAWFFKVTSKTELSIP